MKLAISITKVHTNVDMRGVHKLRTKVTCQVGEAWLFINKSATIARLVDSVHGVHTYYAPKGEAFDLAAISTALNAMRLTLEVPNAKQRARVLKLAA